MSFGMTLEERRASLLARERLLGTLRRRRPRRRGQLRPMRQPDGARVEYARSLNAAVRELEQVVRAEFGDLEELVRRNQLGRNDAADEARLDDVWDDIGDKLRRLRAAAARIFDDTRLKALAFRVGQAVSSHNKAEVVKQLSSAISIDVFGTEEPVRRQLAVFVADNVRLIKSIPEQALTQVEGVVLSGVRRGARASEIAGSLKERFGVTRSRATLIARDQVGKFNGELTQLRHQEAGIDGYIWRTSKDERVRKEHRDRDGEHFKWSKPPEGGHPGEAVQCRCTAEPDLEKFLLPEDRPS
jgi:SPP1 gp7 family putative phage head morphogenesis protein